MNIIAVNDSSWIVCDDWERYSRYADISLFGVIPPIARINEVFNSNFFWEVR